MVFRSNQVKLQEWPESCNICVCVCIIHKYTVYICFAHVQKLPAGSSWHEGPGAQWGQEGPPCQNTWKHVAAGIWRVATWHLHVRCPNGQCMYCAGPSIVVNAFVWMCYCAGMVIGVCLALGLIVLRTRTVTVPSTVQLHQCMDQLASTQMNHTSYPGSQLR